MANAQDLTALKAEKADTGARIAQLHVREAVLTALETCGTEPPAGEADFGEWAACLRRELVPAVAEAPATEPAADVPAADAPAA